VLLSLASLYKVFRNSFSRDNSWPAAQAALIAEVFVFLLHIFISGPVSRPNQTMIDAVSIHPDGGTSRPAGIKCTQAMGLLLHR